MRDGPRDECGVFGLYAPGHEVSRLSYFALYALQHRGQESAGIAAADRGGHIVTRRELGVVSQVFSENDLRTLAGELAIGHVRYSTTGSNAWENSQPVQRSEGTNGSRREVALAHNGNLINALELHEELAARGVTFSSTSDSEIIAAMIATHPAERVEDAIADVLPRLRGAFSIVAMTKDRVVAFRDPHGLRPLALGVLDSDPTRPSGTDGREGGVRYCVASESCAFDIIGASFLPQDDGFVKNRYVARTFIQPGQELRKHGLRLKFNPLPDVIAGKRLVVVDDSIVRGNTTRQIVQMLRDGGAAEVHLRISAPPIKHPCHYGIDMSTREEMIAHGRSTDEIAAELGCDSLHYLSLAGVYEAVGATRATHCDACFTGSYPLAGSEHANGKYALEERSPQPLPLVRA